MFQKAMKELPKLFNDYILFTKLKVYKVSLCHSYFILKTVMKILRKLSRP